MEIDDLLSLLQAAVPLAGLVVIGLMLMRQRRISRETDRILRKLNRSLMAVPESKSAIIPGGRMGRSAEIDPGLN